MSIPESQLQTWSRYIQTDKAINTHQSIRNVINNHQYSKEYEYEDYLQGSYKNNTNIWSDTDVDIVIQLNSIFRGNKKNLNEEERKKYENYYESASYTLQDFKNEIIDVLFNKYRNRLQIGKKSIKILKDSNNSVYDADIVVAMQYRLYTHKKDENTKTDNIGLNYYEGILFNTSDGKEIINFPKIHYKNGVKKHKNTNKLFKPVVRIFKNMRNELEEKYFIPKNLAPSYFIQCLLYNVPDYIYLIYSDSLQELIDNILMWLYENINENFVSQNEIVPLFGNEDDKWDLYKAKDFIENLQEMWKEW